jgi:ubiquinone/menaquinone biosynthesis C-methylase UbiE/superfamily II DNA or RNA helicase
MIAEYLGDFMLSKNEWQPTDVIKIREVMDIEGIREEILINLKNASLTFVNSERKLNPDANEEMLIEVYFQKPEMTLLASSGIQEVASALEELREYYAHIFRLREKKPGNITDSLREGRIFPDINQLVNIQEMSEKKKMLIADEMGLGKSASAILTKEYFGLRCGLVIVPSNVVDTWKNYLSDSINERGKQVGYFKKGLAPKVLIIESPKDLEKLQTEVFDYILVSQEKISGEGYGTVLGQVDFDMMIVDEVHKLKNIETGVRSKAVDALAVKIEGQDKYLALLSGTPVPNKVKDIAITLKLLYPEKYKEFSSKEMVRRILYGDLIDLRSELLKRMQMKELAASIEMPKLTESDISVELAPEEREIYEILLEEDELTALDKILLFRQFLLNPEILKVEPGFVGSKIKQLDETLNEDLKTQQKIIVFVNGYVEGVIKGEHNIIQKMHLPEGTMVEEIHGDISKEERKRIEEELKFGNQKTVVFVSGQTADVGVDFSGADGLIFYNDPWSKYEKNQQRGRVYREGLKNPLSSKTLVTKNSIEQGIRQYINAKEKAIEKLLRGISNTEAEKKLLYNDSKLVHADVETNAQLSKEYLSDWEKLMIHFGEGFESGEKRFREELSKTGKEYANLYRKLGRLTYQGNNARVTTTLIEKMVDERKEAIDSLHIVDIASGPEMLKEAASEKIKGKIFSMDINAEHFAQSAEPEKTISASYLNLPLPDSSVDYTNLGFAFHQTSPIKYFKKNYERLQVLAEMNRVLKPGGRAIISMLHNIEFTNRETFQKLIERLGFQFVPEYTGDAASKENYKSGIFTLEKVSDIPEYKSDALKFDSADNARYIAELGDKLGRELLEGLEIKKTTKGRSNIRDQRRMIEKVTIGDREIELVFNSKDRELLTEELQSIKDGEDLKKKYGGIQNIPIEEIKKIGFERKLETPGYYLLYKIIKDGGAVIIRGDYRSKARKESIPV